MSRQTFNGDLIAPFVVISGCSGGGKSTLLHALQLRGYQTVPEPGRRIVQQEKAGEGSALPWVDLAAFAVRAVAMASADFDGAPRGSGWVFFDRGLVDALAALAFATGNREALKQAASRRYWETVFLAPPWQEIYANDDDRQHGFAQAVEEYERLKAAYAALGYETVDLPRMSVERRVDFLFERLPDRPGP